MKQIATDVSETNMELNKLGSIDQIDKEILYNEQLLTDEVIAQADVAQVESEKTEEELIATFKADLDNQNKALYLASQIQDMVGKNWFTLLRLQSKAKLTPVEAYQKIQMCKLFGFIEAKMGDFRDGTKNVSVPMFKVVITNESRKEALDQIIQYHKDQIIQFEIQKSLL